MITYDLALKLKNAGFKQSGNGSVTYGERFEEKEVYMPTLSDIIETCGDEFWTLEYLIDPEDITGWVAFRREYPDVGFHGLTAIEAVANLYIELNKK